MKLLIVSHKPCWASADSPSGYATDGGFPFQMRALAELFDETKLLVPCAKAGDQQGELPLTGEHFTVRPLEPLAGDGWRRKLNVVKWLVRNCPTLAREVLRADAVHAPIPGDVGTIGMLLAFILRKPLFVRHCGNWFVQNTVAEHFWRWFMESFAGGRNVMLATGGHPEPPSRRNPNIRWIFSTTLTGQELKQCEVERRAPVAGEPLRLIIVCRQDREKGAGPVIESLPLLLLDFPQVTLDVVGDGAALGDLKKLTVSLDVQERVRFHGKVTHTTVIQLLKRAHLFCYPTTASEGFPKVVLEALACGLPVITTRVSVLPELIGRHGSGVLIEETGPPAIAQAVKEIVGDSERYLSMSEQAKETARHYSLERWRDTIGAELQGSIHAPLRSQA